MKSQIKSRLISHTTLHLKRTRKKRRWTNRKGSNKKSRIPGSGRSMLGHILTYFKPKKDEFLTALNTVDEEKTRGSSSFSAVHHRGMEQKKHTSTWGFCFMRVQQRQGEKQEIRLKARRRDEMRHWYDTEEDLKLLEQERRRLILHGSAWWDVRGSRPGETGKEKYYGDGWSANNAASLLPIRVSVFPSPLSFELPGDMIHKNVSERL